MKQPYPTTEALSAMVRASDPKAIAYVVHVLKANGGNMIKTSAALGLKEPKSLYLWKDKTAALAEAMKPHLLGRSGAARQRMVTVGKLSVPELVERTGLTRQAIHARIKAGWSETEMLAGARTKKKAAPKKKPPTKKK